MFDEDTDDLLTDIGLLVLRISVAAFMVGAHGWGKFIELTSGAEIQFADPFGLGEPVTFVLAVFSEFVCSILIAVGLATRAAAVPLLITMLTAGLIIHGGDEWIKQERALLYIIPYLTLIFTGGGRFSLDQIVVSRRN